MNVSSVHESDGGPSTVPYRLFASVSSVPVRDAAGGDVAPNLCML